MKGEGSAAAFLEAASATSGETKAATAIATAVNAATLRTLLTVGEGVGIAIRSASSTRDDFIITSFTTRPEERFAASFDISSSFTFALVFHVIRRSEEA